MSLLRKVAKRLLTPLRTAFPATYWALDHWRAELHRVLAPGGLIWIQVPFRFPYHESPNDYWRVSPKRLRIWMVDFELIRCRYDFLAQTALVAGSYYDGRKQR